MARLLDRATCDDNHDRFIRRIIESETVWYLQHTDGVANSVSNEDEETTILMFWSDIAYAKRVRNNGFEDYQERSMDLFEFLYRWLPGMSGDGVLAGTNWTGDLIGCEHDVSASVPRKTRDVETFPNHTTVTYSSLRTDAQV